MWQMLIGAGLGALKGKEQQQAFNQQKMAAATQSRFSPWTGMGPGQVGPAPSKMNAILQGMMAGLEMGKESGGGGNQAAPNANQFSQSSQSNPTDLMYGINDQTQEPMVAGQYGPYRSNFYADPRNYNQSGNLYAVK